MKFTVLLNLRKTPLIKKLCKTLPSFYVQEKIAFAYSDNHMQAITAAQLRENDIAVGISHSGSSKDIIDALKIAQEHGVKTVCITNKGKSPI